MPSTQQRTKKCTHPNLRPESVWPGMNAGLQYPGMGFLRKPGARQKWTLSFWVWIWKQLAKHFFRLCNKRVGLSFALVSRLHCACSRLSLVLFTWVIPFEFGPTTCMCKVTHMLSVFFIYWNYVGLYFFHFLVQPSSCWHQGYCEAAQPFWLCVPDAFSFLAKLQLTTPLCVIYSSYAIISCFYATIFHVSA